MKTDIAKGLRLLADALDEFPKALAKCKGAEADIKHIVDALEQIHSPKQFAFHVGKDLLVNHHARARIARTARPPDILIESICPSAATSC